MYNSKVASEDKKWHCRDRRHARASGHAPQFHIMYVSVNAIRPQRRARTRAAIGEIRHVFVDADKDGDQVLKTIGERRDLPLPSYVIHSSPGRLHALWQVTRFSKEGVEALQKQLASELGTDKAATSCSQLTVFQGSLTTSTHRHP